jgi:hypothetical protein
MSALMAERRESGRQESLFEGLAQPRSEPWAPRDASAPADEVGGQAHSRDRAMGRSPRRARISSPRRRGRGRVTCTRCRPCQTR